MVDWSGHHRSLVPVIFMRSSSSISMGPLEDVGKWHDIKYHVSICPVLQGDWCLFEVAVVCWKLSLSGI